jgi:DNA replication protein DnaC
MSDTWKDRVNNARQRRQSEPSKLGSSGTSLRMPDSLFERLGGKPTAEESTWTCEVCGPVEPTQYANGYIPGKCACQLEQRRKEEERKQRMEAYQARQAMIKTRIARCYNWLGNGWSDEGLEQKTFENFNDDVQTEGLMAATTFATQKKGNLILWSDKSFGTGKTHLAAAIIYYLLNEGFTCRFTTAQNLFNAFGARMDDHHGYSDLLKEASDCDLLAIDDLDKVNLTAFKQSIFFEVLDKRYKRGKPTVITTNAYVQVTNDDIIGISDYIGQAAASRLAAEDNGGLIVQEMNGEDYRRRKRNA